MKVTVKYYLPDDEFQYECMLQAELMYDVISEMAAYLRQLDKYGDSETVNISELREKFHALITENRVNLDL